jgi:hypothetical protein
MDDSLAETVLIKPIDPDVSNPNLFLNINWYQTTKLPGISFMIRAKNEARNIGTCLLSIQKYLPAAIPYEIILINNDSSDYTSAIANKIISVERGDKVVDYPYRIAKPGLENYHTPVDSIHSFIYFTQFCMMQCNREWIFRWDADFEMTAQLGQFLQSFWEDHKLKQEYGARTFEYVMIPASDQDGIVNSEMYLFHTQTRPFFYRHHIWEQINFLHPGQPPYVFSALPSQALILHQSTLKVIKSSYLEEAWWETKLKNPSGLTPEYLEILKAIAMVYQKSKDQFPADAQTFCRSMDPKPIEVVRYLTPTIEFPLIHKKLKVLFG